MGRLFGTDGVRGVAGCDLTAGLALDLAAAAAAVLAGTGAFAAASDAHRRPLAVVGRDPRASGEFLEAAVVAGLASSGVDVLRLGVIPTPAVAYLTAALGAEFGVMLSASHNPAPDNGIKFFARGGVKLPDDVEDQIEARLAPDATGADAVAARPRAARGGPAASRRRASGGSRCRWRRPVPRPPAVHAPASGPARRRVWTRRWPGCAWLSTARTGRRDLAPRLLRAAGAEVIAIGTEPDGLNINEGCGSTHLDVLCAAVLGHAADAGIAHDGDADRCLAVDADGQVIDGDQILAVLALAMRMPASWPAIRW